MEVSSSQKEMLQCVRENIFETGRCVKLSLYSVISSQGLNNSIVLFGDGQRDDGRPTLPFVPSDEEAIVVDEDAIDDYSSS